MILQTSTPAPTRLYPVLLATTGMPPVDHQAAPSGRRRERLLGKRVLIVEDEAMVALELQYAFEDEGAQIVGPAQTLRLALDRVEQDRDIDVALLDVDLAGENIYPVADLLRERGVPFAFHTGHGSRSEMASLFPGATTFMKPALPEALIEHLARIAG